ncbi:MAG TPA: glycosyl hydrolase [Solirubrobacterales bacterium]|nr:glycosyl hydrolase [Solirubrobacterales bacterium]
MAAPVGKRIRKLLAAVAVSAPFLLSMAGPGATTAQAAPIQLGAFLPGNSDELDQYGSMVGRRPDILLLFRNLSGPLLYSSEISTLRSHGVTPMVTLEPYTDDGVASFSEIASSTYDEYFRRQADQIRGLGITVMLRFAHEMNLLSSDWGPGKEGNTPSGYVEAWRHIVTIFRQEGAENVKWVWAPNVDYGGRPFTQFFPGDEWVDYVALDGYNWGASEGEPWETFSQIFASSYATITALSTKPVIIAETGSSETGGDKAAWIEESFFSTIPEQMPRVAAVIWFNDAKERDWRVNSSQASLEAWRRVVGSTLYGGDQPPPVRESAPVVDDLEVVPKVAPKGKRHRRPVRLRVRGRITYRLSHRAIVRIALHRPRGGAAPLVFSAEQHAGHKRVALSRLVGSRHLRRGHYSVSVVAFSAGGDRSRPRHHGFRLTPPRRSRRS